MPEILSRRWRRSGARAGRGLGLRLGLRLGLACALVAAATASAETLLFEGTFSVSGIGGPAPVGTAVGVATVNGSDGGLLGHVTSLRIPGGLFTAMSTSTPTGTSPFFTKLVVSLAPGAGTFTGDPGGPLAGVLPVPGNVRVCLLFDCGFSVNVPFTESGTRGVGIGGTVTAPLLGSSTLSIMGVPWADVPATITTSTGVFTTPGFAHGPASLTSSTAQTGGVIQVVTPIAVSFNLDGQPPLVLPLFGVLNVRFLPEPSTFALLAAGAAAIALLGRRRLGRR
jgi:hypothetical protein